MPVTAALIANAERQRKQEPRIAVSGAQGTAKVIP